MEFTLDNLVRVLGDGGFNVVSSGPDRFFISVEVQRIVEGLGAGKSPVFFATVEMDGGVIAAVDRLSKVLWSTFVRGQMGFEAQLLDDGRSRVLITSETS